MKGMLSFNGMRSKRGQMFILAAVILSTLLFSTITTVNQILVTEDNDAFYNYAEGVRREANYLLDYQVYSGISSENLEHFVDVLEADFKESGIGGNFMLIYGNSTLMQMRNLGIDGVSVGDNSESMALLIRGGSEKSKSKISLGGTSFSVEQDNSKNTKVKLLKLKKGEDLEIIFDEQVYKFPVSDVNQVIFIIQKDENGETYVEVR
ncbi:MAG: hypothetical protein ACI83O_000100 [Patescibacteria group bacterium]|jgi:hypothetical protein